MPCYFGQKGHNKQTWQFRKTHPQLRVLQKEAKAQMNFFDQMQEAPGKSSVSGGDSATVDITRATENNDNNITRTADNSSTEDQNSKEHFCVNIQRP